MDSQKNGISFDSVLSRERVKEVGNMRFKALFIPLIFLCWDCTAQSALDKSFDRMNNREINQTISEIHKNYPRVSQRIVEISAHFLGIPYRLGPLGEGSRGEFDRKPLISFSAVDCTTFVEETMALSLARDLNEAKEILKHIRYKGGVVSYQTRNHFPSVDWIPNNIAAGFIKDITARIAGPDIEVASKWISKEKWYREKKISDITGFPKMSPEEKENLLQALRGLGESMPDEEAQIPYLPIRDFEERLAQIPSGTIANLVRADRLDKPVLISHQVFIIQKGGETYIRHAAFDSVVKDVPALEYFSRYESSKWPLLGINLDEVVDPNKSQNK